MKFEPGLLRVRSRVRALIACVSAIAASLLPIGCSEEREQGPPNVILVSLDTLRADHLGLYGYSRDTSPHLDALASESIVFDWAIAPASATQPSHRSLYQSRLASHARRRFTSLPQVFREAGYRTAGFTGGGNVSRRFGLARGYEHYVEDEEGFSATFPLFESWLRENHREPFFVFLHSFDIHHPYDVVPPYSERFLPEYRGRVTGPDTLNILSKIRGIFPHKNFKGQVALSRADKAKIVALYDGGIVYADEYVGRLVALLKKMSLWDDTILVVLSDHGEEFWEHDNVTHSFTVYDEVLHVPLLWRVPGHASSGLRVARRVHLMDVAPTLLDLAGLPVPESFMGRSLLPFESLDDRAPEDAAGATEIVSEMFTLKSLIDYPWKIIKEYPDGKRHLAEEPLVLYNLEEDPGETNNLAARHPRKARELELRLEATLAHQAREQVRAVPKVVDDPDLRRQLEALGYVIGDPDPDPDPGAPLSD